MYISLLNTSNFRNQESLRIDLSMKLNIFIGGNAQGKTNILEALYILGSSKSFRVQNDKYLIKNEMDFAEIASISEKSKIKNEINVQYARTSGDKIVKRLMINGKAVKKVLDFVGHVNFTIMAPDDISLIKGDGSSRRRYLDAILCQIDSSYLFHALEYNKIIKQRNYLLRSIGAGIENESSLVPWDEQMIQTAVHLTAKRVRAMQTLHAIAHQQHELISQCNENLSLFWMDTTGTVRPSSDFDETAYADRLGEGIAAARREELARGMSVIGPHRDDIEITLNGQACKYFGSQGQQRSVAISLRMAEIEYIREQTSEYPILLVDDIFSELDDVRKQGFMSLLAQDTQMFMTGTRASEFSGCLSQARVFQVERGRVREGLR